VDRYGLQADARLSQHIQRTLHVGIGVLDDDGGGELAGVCIRGYQIVAQDGDRPVSSSSTAAAWPVRPITARTLSASVLTS
jgi:hypothetical protein